MSSAAFAGAAPPEVIPWDSVSVADTIGTDRGGSPIVDTVWIYYITRTHYEVFVYGKDYSSIQETSEKLKKIELYLKRRKAEKAGDK